MGDIEINISKNIHLILSLPYYIKNRIQTSHWGPRSTTNWLHFIAGTYIWLVSTGTLHSGLISSLCYIPTVFPSFAHCFPFFHQSNPILQECILLIQVPLFHEFRSAIYWLKHCFGHFTLQPSILYWHLDRNMLSS